MGPRRRASFCAAAFALAVSGCSCEETQLAGGRSRLIASEQRIDFGRVFTGAEVVRTFFLRAPGELPINYRTSLHGQAFGYQVGPAVARLGANDQIQIEVIFRPGREGPSPAWILFESDATENATVTVSLDAIGVDPPDCEDGNGCTVDRFDIVSGRCEHKAERLACDDRSACTGNDFCVDGICLGESLDCDDDNPCTDDLCDPVSGCIHRPALSCDDDNPCTADTCDLVKGCIHNDLEDGTPCNDLEQCTTADICVIGRCIGVNVMDGTVCDDGEPCSKHDRCMEGECRDPTYERPAFGALKFETEIGPTAPGAASNPILDRDGTLYVGVEGGAAAVDRCGAILWTNQQLGTPRWSAAVATPGAISVPVGDRVVDIERSTGRQLGTLELSSLLPPPATSSTATVAVVLDLAVRSSGALIASVMRPAPPGGRPEGLLAEIDRSHRRATVFRRLGTHVATRLAVDRDEAVIAILSDRDPAEDQAGLERLIRFGIENVPAMTWATTGTIAQGTELALGPDGEVLWTYGLMSVSREGESRALAAPDASLERASFDGSPIVTSTAVVWVRPLRSFPLPGPGLVLPAPHELVAVDLEGRLLWSRPLPAPAAGKSPVVDTLDQIFLVGSDGVLRAFHAPDGEPLFTNALGRAAGGRTAVSINPDGVVVVVIEDRVFGIQSIATLGRSSWPRHRRDNLSTGHR